MARRERNALRRQKLAKASYSEHLMDLFFTQGVDAPDLPGIRTADLRRVTKRIKRQTRVRS